MNCPTADGFEYLLKCGFTVTYTIKPPRSYLISWINPGEFEDSHPIKPFLGLRNIGFTEERMRLFANYCWEALSIVTQNDNTTPDEMVDELIQALDIVDEHDVYLAGQAVRAITTMYAYRKENALA